MFKSEDQSNSRLNSDRNLANRFGRNDPGATAPAQSNPIQTIIIPEPEPTKPSNVEIKTLQQPGNKLGKKKLSLAQRNEVAVRARLGETQRVLAKEFNVSQNTISAIEKGQTKIDERSVNERLDDVQDVAMSKLLTSLGYITGDKMEQLSAVNLSVVANNMSRIIGNIRRQDDNGPKVVVQIYAPELKKESSYKALDV